MRVRVGALAVLVVSDEVAAGGSVSMKEHARPNYNLKGEEGGNSRR